MRKERIVVSMADGVSVATLGDEAVILDARAGMYYGLNRVGARILSLLDRGRTVDEIRDLLLDEFEVEPERLERDIRSFLEEMERNRLIVAEIGECA